MEYRCETQLIGFAHSFHDSALAIVNSEGEVVFAEATERYTQVKRALYMPPDLYQRTGQIIKRYCDPGAKLVVARTWRDTNPRWVRSKLKSLNEFIDHPLPSGRPLSEGVKRWAAHLILAVRAHAAAQCEVTSGLEFDLRQLSGFGECAPVRAYDHHLTHAAAAAFTSPMEEAVVAILDGHGEEGADACYSYKDGKLHKIHVPKESESGSLGELFAMYASGAVSPFLAEKNGR